MALIDEDRITLIPVYPSFEWRLTVDGQFKVLKWADHEKVYKWDGKRWRRIKALPTQ